jgi:hemoglobin
MSWAFGGPANYKGRDLKTAHAGLVQRGLGDAHFDAVARHLATTLEDLGVTPDLIGEALAIVGGQRTTVLGK